MTTPQNGRGQLVETKVWQTAANRSKNEVGVCLSFNSGLPIGLI
jgi:hypothetical protein